MAAYEQYLAGELVEHAVTQSEIDHSLAQLRTPQIVA
jgi:hypothetical protein